MNQSNKILLFYPHNFFEMSSGTHLRVHQLITALWNKSFQVDLFSLEGFSNLWPESDRKRYTYGKLHIFPWDKEIGRRNRPRPGRERRLPDLTSEAMRREFRRFFANGGHDFVVVSYAFWTKLIDGITGVPRIIDLHDCITLNEHQRFGRGQFTLGRMFQDEIQAIDRFDFALSISEEESLFLQTFCNHAVFVNLAVYFPKRFSEIRDFKYDLLFVGSENPFNVEGLHWFFYKVYPLLPKCKIVVVGGVADSIKDFPGLKKFPHIKNLAPIYQKSKMVICPLLGGTGLKVKVAEALSFGRPIVTTRWGLTGIAEKKDNGCLVADEASGFADAIYRLSQDDALLVQKEQEACTFFEKKFSFGKFSRRLDLVFGNADSMEDDADSCSISYG